MKSKLLAVVALAAVGVVGYRLSKKQKGQTISQIVKSNAPVIAGIYQAIKTLDGMLDGDN